MSDHRDRIIARMEAEADYLREEVRRLRALLVPPHVLPAEWRLSPNERTLLKAIRAAAPGGLTNARAIAAVYGVFEDELDDPASVCRQAVCHIRRKLKPFGIVIPPIRSFGRGWTMPPEACRAYDAALTSSAPDFLPDTKRVA